jgi:predicted PurR-regulated permease PerM
MVRAERGRERIVDGRSSTARNALVIIAVILTGAAVYWLRGILTPLALAAFLLIMIDGFARTLRKRLPSLPNKAAMPVAITLVLVVLGLSIYVVTDNINGFINDTTEYVPRLNARIADVAQRVGLGEEAPTIQSLVGRVNPGQIIGLVAQAVRSFASDAVFVLIYLGFLIATRRGFSRKARSLFPDPNDRREANEVMDGVRTGVEKYLYVQTVTGGMIALASWALMAALGESNAWFWAFFIFLTGYVPIVGAAVGTIAPALFAFVDFDTLWQPLVIFAGLQGINFFVGNVIYPRMQGDSLNLDPVVVLLALAFWGLLWGLPGAFLSTPLTVMAMIILAQFKGSRWIAVLISNNGNPEGADQARSRETDRGAREPGRP